MSRFIFPLILLAAAVSLFAFFTRPLIAQIGELRIEKTRLEVGLENAKKLKQVRDGLIATSREFPASDLERLNKMLPDNVDNVRLIIDINNLARGSSMSIRNIDIKVDEGETGKDVITKGSQKQGAVTLAFSVSGPYNNFQDFLNRLAQSLRLVDVTALNFASNDKNFYDYDVELQTYWLK